MKKFTAIVVSLLMAGAVFAQSDWGENLGWKEAFYSYVAGSNLTLNENQKMFLIKKDFYDDWKQFHEDEFEWEDHKANDVKAIQDEINTYKNYKEKNAEYDYDKVVLYVNIGIDKDFYTDIKTVKEPDDMLVLVNKYHALPSGWNASNLVNLSSKYSYNGQKLNSTAAEALTQMIDDMRDLGYTMWVVSGYRSEDYQYGLYNYYVRTQTQKVADRTSARPNHSEHQTGLAADISNIQGAIDHFANTDEYLWLKDNAHKYGFIERYPKDKEFLTGYDYEPWHYRYLGVEIATKIHDEQITYEEYVIKYLKK